MPVARHRGGLAASKAAFYSLGDRLSSEAAACGRHLACMNVELAGWLGWLAGWPWVQGRRPYAKPGSQCLKGADWLAGTS